jgi:hypothetical protein
MGRKVREQAAVALQVPQEMPEEVQTSWVTTDAPNATIPAPMQTPSSMLDGAQRGPDLEAEPPHVRRYQVVRDGRVVMGGGIVYLKAGKVVDDQSYSIQLLQLAGIQLAEV